MPRAATKAEESDPTHRLAHALRNAWIAAYAALYPHGPPPGAWDEMRDAAQMGWLRVARECIRQGVKPPV
jgi:hypothetical protein